MIGEAIDPGPALVFVADEEIKYVAVNAYACTALGYGREELLALRVPDVAHARETPTTYDRFLDAGEMAGRTSLRHKDGRLLSCAYRARTTAVAGMTLYVSVGWLDEPD